MQAGYECYLKAGSRASNLASLAQFSGVTVPPFHAYPHLHRRVSPMVDSDVVSRRATIETPMNAIPLQRDDVYYPESDGQPMAETDLHRNEMYDLIHALRRRYRDVPDV